MSRARDAILARLRAQRPSLPEAPATATPANPAFTPEQRVRQFREHLEAVRAEVHRVPRDGWVPALQGLAAGKGVARLLHAPDGPLGPEIAAGWDPEAAPALLAFEGEIGDWKERLFLDTPAAVTSARAGIAATGTLVLWPTPAEPRSWSLVPPIHFAVLDASDLHDSFAQLIEAEGWRAGMPSNALLISGPSKTADIEQTLSYGIHGPMQLVVLLLA